MQQSSATPSLHLSFWGLRKIVAYSHSSSQCLLVSTVFGTVSFLHPTSFLIIFILVIIGFLEAQMLKGIWIAARIVRRQRLEISFRGASMAFLRASSPSPPASHETQP